MICFDETALHPHANTKQFCLKQRKGLRGFASDRVQQRTLHTFSHAHIKINACISLQASAQQAEAGDGNGAAGNPLERKTYNTHKSGSASIVHSHSHTNVVADSQSNPTRHLHTPPENRQNTHFPNNEAAQTHSHSFSVLRPTYEIKKETQK